jgi:hypothetical protein
MEKVIRYRTEKGLLYETAVEALICEFSRDCRAQKIAAAVSCGSEALLWSLWANRTSAVALLRDMENALDGQENK